MKKYVVIAIGMVGILGVGQTIGDELSISIAIEAKVSEEGIEFLIYNRSGYSVLFSDLSKAAVRFTGENLAIGSMGGDFRPTDFVLVPRSSRTGAGRVNLVVKNPDLVGFFREHMEGKGRFALDLSMIILKPDENKKKEVLNDGEVSIGSYVRQVSTFPLKIIPKLQRRVESNANLRKSNGG